jgi:hypothetical protein
MVGRVAIGGRTPPALKHGAFSRTHLLPGENAEEFERLHTQVVDELKPAGALEHDCLDTIARLLWRKQHLHMLDLAQEAASRRDELIKAEYRRRDIDIGQPTELFDGQTEEIAARKAAERDGEAKARKELGTRYDLIGKPEATEEGMLRRMAIEERLDEMIARYLKRFMIMKGVKTMVDSQFLQPARAANIRRLDPPAASEE